MKFRLTYEGNLFATQGEPINGQRVPRAPHVHSIRRAFHEQLKEHWKNNKFLSSARLRHSTYLAENAIGLYNQDDQEHWPEKTLPLYEVIARKYTEFNYSWVPLIREEARLICSLDILFLRRDPPGSILSAGDIDNRLKTLIDALRMPANAAELRENETPRPDEKPFFCLLQDDKQITRLAVETDTLLIAPSQSAHAVKLFITVEIRPYNIESHNIDFL